MSPLLRNKLVWEIELFCPKVWEKVWENERVLCTLEKFRFFSVISMVIKKPPAQVYGRFLFLQIILRRCPSCAKQPGHRRCLPAYPAACPSFR